MTEKDVPPAEVKDYNYYLAKYEKEKLGVEQFKNLPHLNQVCYSFSYIGQTILFGFLIFLEHRFYSDSIILNVTLYSLKCF